MLGCDVRFRNTITISGDDDSKRKLPEAPSFAAEPVKSWVDVCFPLRHQNGGKQC